MEAVTATIHHLMKGNRSCLPSSLWFLCSQCNARPAGMQPRLQGMEPGWAREKPSFVPFDVGRGNRRGCGIEGRKALPWPYLHLGVLVTGGESYWFINCCIRFQCCSWPLLLCSPRSILPSIYVKPLLQCSNTSWEQTQPLWSSGPEKLILRLLVSCICHSHSFSPLEDFLPHKTAELLKVCAHHFFVLWPFCLFSLVLLMLLSVRCGLQAHLAGKACLKTCTHTLQGCGCLLMLRKPTQYHSLCE